MFTTIGMDNFDSDVMLEMRPVLLACIHRGFEAKEQLKVLEAVSIGIAWNVKICLLYEGTSKVYRELSIKGTPTFLLYVDGEEIGRVLGKLPAEKLIKFVSAKLAQQLGDLEHTSLPSAPR